MSQQLSLRQLNRASLDRQGLLDRPKGGVAEVVGGLAGLQAQHANSPYVALWSRRESQAIADLEQALINRDVVKATLMRSTLHLVATVDFPALDVAASIGRMGVWRATARKTGVELEELHAALMSYCVEPRTVAEMEAHIQEVASGRLRGEDVPSGVRGVGFRMASAGGGLVHVPPSGLWKSHGRPSYVASQVWLGDHPVPSPDEALQTAIERYLGAYGPALPTDILKWVGERRITSVRAALEALGDEVVRYDGPDGELVDLADRAIPDADVAAPARFLSRWDSLLIGYAVRDRILPDAYRSAVIKKNGDFLPTFLVDGFVGGLWSVKESKGEAVLALEPFEAVPASVRRELEAEGEQLVRYAAPEADCHVVSIL